MQERGEKISFGKSFWIYQNLFCFGTPGGLQKLSTKTFFSQLQTKTSTKTRIADQRRK